MQYGDSQCATKSIFQQPPKPYISLFKSTTAQRQKAISAFLAMTSMHPDVEKVVETDQELYKQLKPEIEKSGICVILRTTRQYKADMKETDKHA